MTPSDIFNAKILIVDDREDNVELIYGMLSRAGYTSVESTMNPLEVCDLHRAKRYDLILLDLMMPVMDGFQVMEGIQAVEAEAQLPIEQREYLPVLVITAQSEHKERALKAGAKGFITKPFDRLAVLTHIRDVLEIRFLQKELQQFVTNLETVLDERTAPLREAEELFDQLAGNLPQVFWIWDAHDRTLRYVNPAWERLTGRPVLRGDKVEKFLEAVHPEDVQRVISETRELSQEAVDHDYRLLLSDNSIRWVHSRTFPVKDSTGVQKVVGIMDDITDRKEAGLRLFQLAHYDALTSLPNRTLFYESLRKLIKQAEMNHRMVSVLFLDIDNFKNINDTLGHALGDELLCQFSLRLSECLRITDMVARLGGDEFACILVTTDSSGDAGVVASKIRETLRQPFNLGGTPDNHNS